MDNKTPPTPEQTTKNPEQNLVAKVKIYLRIAVVACAVIFLLWSDTPLFDPIKTWLNPPLPEPPEKTASHLAYQTLFTNDKAWFGFESIKTPLFSYDDAERLIDIFMEDPFDPSQLDHFHTFAKMDLVVAFSKDGLLPLFAKDIEAALATGSKDQWLAAVLRHGYPIDWISSHPFYRSDNTFDYDPSHSNDAQWRKQAYTIFLEAYDQWDGQDQWFELFKTHNPFQDALDYYYTKTQGIDFANLANNTADQLVLYELRALSYIYLYI